MPAITRSQANDVVDETDQDKTPTPSVSAYEDTPSRLDLSQASVLDQSELAPSQTASLIKSLTSAVSATQEQLKEQARQNQEQARQNQEQFANLQGNTPLWFSQIKMRPPP